MKRYNILTIAGSDASGGAGIQGDLKTIAAHCMHGISAISAITSQNSKHILGVEESHSLEQQLQAILEDIPIAGIKIGMLYSKKNVEIVCHFIQQLRQMESNLKSNGTNELSLITVIPIVLDPLLLSSTGFSLCLEEAVMPLMTSLFPLVTLITPNRHEAEFLLGYPIETIEAMEKAAKELSKQYKTSILIKGGHIEGDNSVDVLCEKDSNKAMLYSAKRETFLHTHGTGCALSTSIACQLAQGETLQVSVSKGKEVVLSALQHGFRVGRGEGNIDTLMHRLNTSETKAGKL